MKIEPKAMALAMGVLWAAVVLFAGVVNLAWDGYASAFLEGVASIYPGYEVGGAGSVIVGTLWAVVDGGIGGFLLAWLYNRFSNAAA